MYSIIISILQTWHVDAGVGRLAFSSAFYSLFVCMGLKVGWGWCGFSSVIMPDPSVRIHCGTRAAILSENGRPLTKLPVGF